MRSPDKRRFNAEKGLTLASLLAAAFFVAGLLDGTEPESWTGPTVDERMAPHRPVDLGGAGDLGRYVEGRNPFVSTVVGRIPAPVAGRETGSVNEGKRESKRTKKKSSRKQEHGSSEGRSETSKERTTVKQTTTTRFVGWIEVEDRGRKTIVEVSNRAGYVEVKPGEVLRDTGLEVRAVVGDELTVVDEEGHEHKGRIITVTRTVPAD